MPGRGLWGVAQVPRALGPDNGPASALRSCLSRAVLVAAASKVVCDRDGLSIVSCPPCSGTIYAVEDLHA